MLVRKKGAKKPIDLQINYKFLLDTWHGLFRQDFLESEYMQNLMSFLYLSYEDPESGIMPNQKKFIFKPFQLCDYDDCNVVFVTEYPTTSNKSSGVGVGNREELYPYQTTQECTQFQSMVEENLYEGRPLLDYDQSLYTSAENNGILYLNMALTCTNKNNKAHVNHWEKFIEYFLKAYDSVTGNKLFVFIGDAKKFAPCIDKEFNTVMIEENSLEKCCEDAEYWNTNIFQKVNDWLIDNYGLPYSERKPFI